MSGFPAVATRRPMSFVSWRTAPTHASCDQYALAGTRLWIARYRLDWADNDSVAASCVGSNSAASITDGYLTSIEQAASAITIAAVSVTRATGVELVVLGIVITSELNGEAGERPT